MDVDFLFFVIFLYMIFFSNTLFLVRGGGGISVYGWSSQGDVDLFYYVYNSCRRIVFDAFQWFQDHSNVIYFMRCQ